MDRETAAEKFYVEDHAVLLALMVKQAESGCGSEGRAAAVRSIERYGKERGMRAAMRCLADGEPLSMGNYILYGEWDDPKGVSKSEAAAFEPNYKTRVTTCGWCEAWKHHGLLNYGRVYCDNVDENLVFGFNPALTLKMDKILSHGDEYCSFDWIGCEFKDAEELSKKRKDLAARVTRDFLYHCGHVLSTFRREICFELGLPKGEKIISQVLLEYKKIFGALKKNILASEAAQNFFPYEKIEYIRSRQVKSF
ncbi:MAG: L-2-amino-thiazoline-4-carboxylic acid hydrolase [Synergistaceae bacterium]|nr:L-2-amino-thiazoline-4-carboxylic acid hydrolase [Synergistaceae bacterium]